MAAGPGAAPVRGPSPPGAPGCFAIDRGQTGRVPDSDLISGFVADIAALQATSPSETRPARAAAATAEALLVRWREPQRAYHDVTHLTEMLSAIAALTAGSGRAASLPNLVAWYHDAIYRPGRTDNEAASAALARSELAALALPAQAVEQIAALIEQTADHLLPEPGSAGAVVHDADLWILAAPGRRFDAYCAQVRREYAAVADTAYAHGRSAILRPLLDRPRLYANPPAGAGWEERARVNLRRELERLTAAGEDGLGAGEPPRAG